VEKFTFAFSALALGLWPWPWFTGLDTSGLVNIPDFNLLHLYLATSLG